MCGIVITFKIYSLLLLSKKYRSIYQIGNNKTTNTRNFIKYKYNHFSDFESLLFLSYFSKYCYLYQHHHDYQQK